jgi:hypothetical protein
MEDTEDTLEVDNPNMPVPLENKAADHMNFHANAHGPRVE